jgi:hypothetical protein
LFASFGDNPYSFLWTFGLFVSLNKDENFSKNGGLFLVPLESHIYTCTPCLILNKKDWENFKVKEKLNRQQLRGVLCISALSSVEELLITKSNTSKRGENRLVYNLVEQDFTNMNKDLLPVQYSF